MSKINATYDTKTKQLGCDVDGKDVDDLHELHFSKSYANYDTDGMAEASDKFNVHMMTHKHDKEQGTKHIYRLVASESTEGQALAGKAQESKDFPGFLLVKDQPQVLKDIEAYFAR